jgi:hypothetical protein
MGILLLIRQIAESDRCAGVSFFDISTTGKFLDSVDVAGHTSAAVIAICAPPKRLME